MAKEQKEPPNNQHNKSFTLPCLYEPKLLPTGVVTQTSRDKIQMQCGLAETVRKANNGKSPTTKQLQGVGCPNPRKKKFLHWGWNDKYEGCPLSDGLPHALE